MSLSSDLEGFSPSSLAPSSRHHHRRFLSFVLLIIPGSFILVLYLQNQLPFALDTSTITIFSSTATADDPHHSPCYDGLPLFYPENSSNFYLLFTPTDPSIVDTTVRRIMAHDNISNNCLEEWVGRGRWSGACLNLKIQEPRVDLVWTWVNGSDPLHHAARALHLPNATSRVVPASMMEKQFRQHDELRFSLRSVMAATRSWKQTTFHLVANSYPIPSDAGYAEEESEEDYEERLGQVPQWLDMKKIDHEVPRFMIHHDVDLFRLLPSSPHKEVSDAEIDAWRNASLPTFNSMAIESQLANLPPSDVSENTVFLMDDTYFLRPLTTSTFYSPIHGPILHLQPNLLVNPSVPGRRLPAGWSEWRGLETAAARISERFGKRGRPYLVHNARAIPLPLLHEASLTFPEAFSSTATSRFRGQNDSMPETHTLWLATHFIIERHREALLWSWVVGKWGGPKGRLTQEDKEKMWLDLGGKSGEGKKRVFWPKRESRLNAQIDLEKAELPDAGVTNYAFVSSDGYPYTYLPMARTYPPLPDQNGWADLASTPTGDKVPVVCTVERTDCFNNDANEPAVEMFKRIMVDKPRCGDCLISALIGASGPTGFSAFLPPSISPKLPHSSMPNHLPVSLASLLAFPYPANPYLFSLRLIQRYSYVLGGTPNRFFGVESAINAKAHLTKIDSDADAALVCINDDLASTDPIMVAALDEVLREWMVSRWPDKLEIERFNGTYSVCV